MYVYMHMRDGFYANMPSPHSFLMDYYWFSFFLLVQLDQLSLVELWR